MKKRWFSICMAFCLAITAMTGCGKKSEKEDKKQDVTITVWNYYNGAQLESFNKLVDEFNKTAGKEKGIVVEAASHGSVEDLQNNVLDSINGVAGAEAVPICAKAIATPTEGFIPGLPQTGEPKRNADTGDLAK